MVLAFKKQFVAKIQAGIKKHTIREDKKNRWKVGNKIHFATGVRTKNYNQFAEGICTLIEPFEIKYEHEGSKTTAEVFVNNELLGRAVWRNCQLISSSFSVDVLSTNDGFVKTNDFFEWFDKDFKGKLIHWKL